MRAYFYQAGSQVKQMRSHGSQTCKLFTPIHASHLEREQHTALKESVSFNQVLKTPQLGGVM